MKKTIFISLVMLGIMAGKTQAQVSYSDTFQYTGSSQLFVVPDGVDSLLIKAWGAQGGNSTWATFRDGGLGAYIEGKISVIPGQVLQILVGQQGENAAVGGGGGGSFIADSSTSQPMVVAGGGGGASSDQNGVNATVSNNGTSDGLGIIAGGINGNGGSACTQPSTNNGGGGGGFYTNGQDANSPGSTNGGYGGKAFINGGAGGVPGRQDGACSFDAYGGFGGGGSTSCYTVGGGGGGGYSGGAGGPHISQCGASIRAGGGGGGSYNAGAGAVNMAAARMGNGLIVLEYTPSSCPTVSINSTTTPTSGHSNGSIDLNVSGSNIIRYCRWSKKEGVNYPSGSDYDLSNAHAGSYYLMLITTDNKICYKGPYTLGTP